MRRTTTTLLALGLAFAAGPVAAQTLLPESRGESQANALNNSLSNQSQNRGIVQQNQFELNALRNQAPQPQVTPPPTVVVPRR